jgi:uncharacterized protein involved in exopolysaccharide biosynthesis
MDEIGNGRWRSATPTPTLIDASSGSWRSQLYEPGVTLDVSRPVAILKHRRWLIYACALLFGLAAGLVSKFALTKWYRAFAVISPNLQENLGQPGSMYGAGLELMLGDMMGSGAVSLAQKYSLIMKSYNFTMDLVDRYNLAPLVWRDKDKLAEAARKNPRTVRWKTYKLTLDRFKSEYDYKSESLTVSFIDPDPAQAKRIVGLYLDLLRSKLREEAVSKAKMLAASLQAEALKAPDPLLQSRLYQLAAQQMQRQIVAQAQSDFFFSIVDPPVASGEVYWPSAKVNALAGVVVGAMLSAALVLVYDSRRARRAEQRETASLPAQRKDEPGGRSTGAALGAR